MSDKGKGIALFLIFFILIVGAGFVALKLVSPNMFNDECTITFDLNGGTGDCPDPVTVSSNEYTFDVKEPTRIGYQFVGWSKYNDVTSSLFCYNNGDTVSISSDITFYAVWDKQTVVYYDLNGGTGYCPGPDYLTSSKYIVSYSSEPVKEDYVFMGWSMDRDVTESYSTIYKNGDDMFVLSDTVLYAAWYPLIQVTCKEVYGYSDGFVYSYGSLDIDRTPIDGYKYVVYKFTVKNVSYGSGFSPRYSDYDVVCSDNNQYSYAICTSTFNESVLNKGSISDITIHKGGSYEYAVVFEVPKNVTAKEIVVEKSLGKYSIQLTKA